MRVLGLDPAAEGRVSAWSKERQPPALYRHGTVAPGARLGLPQRLHDIAARIGEVMESGAPDMVVVEEAFYHESVRSTLVLGHVRGALLVAAVQRGLAVAEYSPREIKLSVAGSGAARRSRSLHGAPAARLARHRLGRCVRCLAAALCHLHRARLSARRAPLGGGAAVGSAARRAGVAVIASCAAR